MASDKEHLFGVICDGEIEIILLTKNDVEEALAVLNDSFFYDESVCIGSEINLPESKQAREELLQLCRIVAEDGLSVVARHVPSGKIVGVAFNKLQYTDNSVEEPFFVEFRNKQCKSPNAISLMDYMIEMDKEVDVFELYNIDCVLEIMFLGTLPAFKRKGIGRNLCKYSIDITRNLKMGIQNIEINPALKEKRPQAVCALFTSLFSQRIGQVLQFKVLNQVPYSKFSFNGKSFDQRIGPLHPFSQQVVLIL